MDYKLPDFQFPGQRIIDAYGVVYEYDGNSDCYVEIGYMEEVPVSSPTQSGLMLSSHKSKLDQLSDKAGGFGLIIDPLLSARTDANPDGVIYGDVKLVSNTITISCVDINGKEISSNCYNCADGSLPPGLNFELSDDFLESFCARLPVIPGPKGYKGPQGPQGKHGTGDGPQGEQGDPGVSYDDPGTFSGVKVLEVDGVYDKAVTALELDNENGVLNVTKSKLTITDPDEASQVYSRTIYRDVNVTAEIGNCGDAEFSYEITRSGDDDLADDVYLFRYPKGFEAPGITEVGTVALSRVVDSIINAMMPQFEEAVENYDKEIEDYIAQKDEEARNKLCALSKQVSECEWSLPMEYCVGIAPSNCHPNAAAAIYGYYVENLIVTDGALSRQQYYMIVEDPDQVPGSGDERLAVYSDVNLTNLVGVSGGLTIPTIVGITGVDIIGINNNPSYTVDIKVGIDIGDTAIVYSGLYEG